MRGLVCYLALSVALSVSGCGATKAAPETPEAVVQQYFAALGEGDYEAARHLELEPPDPSESLYDDRDLLGLKNLRVDSAVANPDEASRLHGVAKSVVVGVSFDRVRRSSIGEAPGADKRFAVVGQVTENSPWRILSYGTGP